jgi:Ulp1 family protease
MKKSTDPLRQAAIGTGRQTVTPKEGRCPHQPDGFECGVLTCWNMEKLLEVPDGGAIEYDYCLVERYRYLILFRILGCVNQ